MTPPVLTSIFPGVVFYTASEEPVASSGWAR